MNAKIMHENILSELYNTANYASTSPKNEIFVANETFLMHSYLYVKAFVMRRYLIKLNNIHDKGAEPKLGLNIGGNIINLLPK